MPTIRELIATQPPSAVNARALLRAIAEHDEWYVSMRSLPAREHFGKVVLPVDGTMGQVPGELWMFTDREAVDRAPQQLGFGSLSGVDLCASLPASVTSAQLNPGSADYLSMQVPAMVRSQLAQLAAAIPLEHELAAAGSAGIHAVGAQTRFFVVIDKGMPVCFPTQDGKVANGIAVFTTADAVDGLMERVPEANRANLQVNSITAKELFHNIGQAPIDGLLINAFGPRASTIVSGEDLAEVVKRATTW